MCRVATGHDLADSFQLRSTTGWQTLQAILQSTGERTPKRPRPDDSPVAAHAVLNPRPTGVETHLAKRFAGVRLDERRSMQQNGK
jgi:nuclear protein localization protein 4 homolog